MFALAVALAIMWVLCGSMMAAESSRDDATGFVSELPSSFVSRATC